LILGTWVLLEKRSPQKIDSDHRRCFGIGGTQLFAADI
jgi:hypothetical protein